MHYSFYRQLCSLTCVAVIAHVSTTVHSQEISLHWQLEKGQTFTVEAQFEAEDRLNVPPNVTAATGLHDHRTTMRQSIHTEWEVADVNADTFVIEQTITRIKVRIEGEMGIHQFDSADQHPPAGIAAMLKNEWQPLVGTSSTFTIDRRGLVSNWKLADLDRQTLKASLTNLDGVIAMLESIVYQASGVVLPGEGIYINSTWEHQVEPKYSLTGDQTTYEYHYKGREERDGIQLHKIAVAATHADLHNGSNATIKEQETEGTMWFDNDRGFLTAGAFNSTILSEMNVLDEKADMTTVTRFNIKIIPK